MKLVSILLVIVFLTGCTTFRPVGLAQSGLQGQIASKKAVQPGEQVKIITNDGKHHRFRVVDVTGDYVEGKNMKVPLADILSIETKEFSGIKTTLLVAGLVALVVLITIGAGEASLMDNMSGPN